MTRSRGFETANDRFKRGFGNWVWGSVTAPAVLHFLRFPFCPTMTSADISISSDEMTGIEIPNEIKIPPPPQQIARPATPVISATAIDDDITIAPTTFEQNPISNLPPPPTNTTTGAKELADAPQWVQMTVRPDLLNKEEAQKALVRNYPPLLRDAGIGGEAVVWFFIDESGKVVKTQLSKPSGYAALDEAALAVSSVMRFSPALNGAKKIPVWVEIPIKFHAK